MTSYPGVDADLLALYVEETRQSEAIVGPLLAAGIEPPHRDVTDRVGLDFKLSNIIDDYASKLPQVDA